MRDAGLRFCQNGAMLVRINLDVMETHKKALRNTTCNQCDSKSFKCLITTDTMYKFNDVKQD